MAERIWMVAGEPSGDAHGGRLAEALLRADPTLSLEGVGGPLMRRAGVETSIDTTELSVMGFAEAVPKAVAIVRCYRRLRRALRASPPQLLILIDFPEFNLRLARFARRCGVPIFYYVSPQVWAWRSGRIEQICRHVDRMVVLFPFEADLYRRRGLDAHYVGHPLVEEVRASRPPQQTRERLGIAPDRALVALLPGSRVKEVTHVLPVMLQAAGALAERASFAIARAPGLPDGLIEQAVGASQLDIAIVEDDTYNLVAASDCVAVTSGTATVECAALGCPMVVLYRMSRLSYAIARRLVRVPFIAMPNILAGERIVPELVQADATPERLAAEVEHYLDDEWARRATIGRLREVRDMLYMPGAVDRAAALALEMLG